MTTAELITTVLIIQLVAIPGAYGFAWLSKRMGNFNALKVAIAIWVAVCIGAYFVHVATEFYVIAMVVGLIMGGTQSLSRSTYSKYLPETEDHASYFSFFDICEKLGIVIGMGTYGYLVQLLGSMRSAVFSLMAFFIIGWVLLQLLPRQRPAS